MHREGDVQQEGLAMSGRPPIYPFRELELMQIRTIEGDPITTARRVSTAASTFCSRNPELKRRFCVRRLKNGAAVWRVE